MTEQQQTVTLRERIIREGRVILRRGEVIFADYAKQLGINADGTDGQAFRVAPGTGEPMHGVEIGPGETGEIHGDGSGTALPPIESAE